MNTNYPITRQARRNNHGFTVIEAMVAMVISLILLLGVINIFMASKTSYSMQSGVSRLQENARFALDNMARNIGMAGLGTQSNLTFTTANTQDNISENADLGFTTATGRASDTIQVNFFNTDANSVDCLGNPAVGNVTAFYEIDDEPRPDGTTVSSLYCTPLGSARQPLVEGVENMQILYGVDTQGAPGGGPDGVADRYVSADNVSDWGGAVGGIASIRIALLVSTVDDAGVESPPADGYHLLDAPEMGPFNDGLLRRVFTRTILLRNYPFTP